MVNKIVCGIISLSYKQYYILAFIIRSPYKNKSRIIGYHSWIRWSIIADLHHPHSSACTVNQSFARLLNPPAVEHKKHWACGQRLWSKRENACQGKGNLLRVQFPFSYHLVASFLYQLSNVPKPLWNTKTLHLLYNWCSSLILLLSHDLPVSLYKASVWYLMGSRQYVTSYRGGIYFEGHFTLTSVGNSFIDKTCLESVFSQVPWGHKHGYRVYLRNFELLIGL